MVFLGGGVKNKFFRIKNFFPDQKKSGSEKNGIKTIATSRREEKEKERKGKERKGRGGRGGRKEGRKERRKEGRKGSKEGSFVVQNKHPENHVKLLKPWKNQ